MHALALESLPLFPLPDTTLFPGITIALHVFEPRYRAMLRDVLASHRALALVRLEDVTSLEEPPRIARIAGVGTILSHELLGDGRSNIVVLGQARVALDELPFDPPYRRAKATVVPDLDENVPDHDKAALLSAATAFVAQMRQAGNDFVLRLPEEGTVGHLADVLAHQLVVTAAVRQAILECAPARKRVRLVIDELTEQSAHFLRKRASKGKAPNTLS